MRKIAFPLTLLSTVLVSLLPAVLAWAQAARTFVSAAGSDSNNCASVATPCRHFAAAYAATSTGGEIVALDPANYGSLTISQAITIEGGGWSYVTPPANGAGISVNASRNTVIIRNLQITGANAANSTGVAVTGGSLILENSALKSDDGNKRYQRQGDAVPRRHYRQRHRRLGQRFWREYPPRPSVYWDDGGSAFLR